MTVFTDQVSQPKIVYLRRRLLSWGRDNFSDFPWRCETNSFHALVAEVLLQRTRAEQVVPVYLRFRQRFPDARSLAEASVGDIEYAIQPLGLRWRARFLSGLGRWLVEADERLPDDAESLRSIPGVGPYAATALLSLHSGRRAAIVDSNVVRLYGRYFGFETGPETRRNSEVLKLADWVTPRRAFRAFNYGLIDFTRSVCKPKPICSECPLANRCSAFLAKRVSPPT